LGMISREGGRNDLGREKKGLEKMGKKREKTTTTYEGKGEDEKRAKKESPVGDRDESEGKP